MNPRLTSVDLSAAALEGGSELLSSDLLSALRSAWEYSVRCCVMASSAHDDYW